MVINNYSGVTTFSHNSNGGGTHINGNLNLDGTGTLAVAGTGNSSFAGNVGIGTAAPGYKLEIGALSGSVEPTSLRIRGSATNVTQIRIGDDYSASVGTLYSGANAFLASNAYQNTLGTANWSKEAPTYASAIAVLGINPTLTIPAFQIKSSPANTASGTYGSFFTSDLFTVLGNGNVGIGTTGPKGKLHTVGINATPTNMAYLANGYSPLYVQSRTDATYGLAVFDANTNTAIQSGDIANGASPTALILNPFSGNVGIGTTNPLGKLTVRTGIDQNLTTTVGSSYGGANGVTLLSTDDGNTAYKDLTVASGNFIINASGGTGNVGIGTSAPGAKLDVNGGIHVAGSSPSAGITLVSKEGYKEVWQLTQGKYTFAFGTLDFYGMMIIRAYGTNYSQGTSEIRVGEWVIPLRYAQSRSLQNIWNYGNVFTNIYNTNGLGLMWANVDNYNSTLTIFNSGSSGPDSALMVQLEFYSSTNGLSGIFTRTSYTDTAYTTNPY